MYFKIVIHTFSFLLLLPHAQLLSTGVSLRVHQEALQEENFCYNENEDCGPSHWSGACQINMGRQSPIDIKAETFDPLNAPSRVLQLQMYSSEQNGFQITNTGHTIQLSLKSATTNARNVVLSYGDLGDYIFQQIHFHWGAGDNLGSEHTVNGSSTPMELHLVHYSAGYPDFNAALKSGDPKSLAVVGVRVETAETENEKLQSIVNALGNVSEASQVGVEVSVSSSFNLERFLPTARDFFAYEGSLTTPPCLEQVQWIFFRDAIKMSRSQISQFRTVYNSHDELIFKNYRPVQPLGDRKIEFYRAVESLNGTGFRTPPIFLLLLTVSSTILQIFG